MPRGCISGSVEIFNSGPSRLLIQISTPHQVRLAWLSRNGRIYERILQQRMMVLSGRPWHHFCGGLQQRLDGESIEAVSKRYDRVAFHREAATLQETL